MRARTIKGSPVRSASEAWAEIDRMIAETLAPASGIADDEVRSALDELVGIGPILVAGGVLSTHPIVLRALPLQLEITVALGDEALVSDESLGKVPGAATSQEWAIYVPDAPPYEPQVHAAVALHRALHSGSAPAEPAPAATTTGAAIDVGALRRISGGAR